MSKLMKVLAIVLCVVALVGGSVAGTLAYLSMKTAPVNNVFTVGDVAITLTPTGISIDKMVPSQSFDATHQVTVKANSVNCYVFLKVDEIMSLTTPTETPVDGDPAPQPPKFADYLTYHIDPAFWTPLDDVPGVYYHEYTTSETDVVYDVFTGDTIVATSTCTKDLYNKLNGSSIGITLTAYAIQSTGFENAPEDAWAEAEKLDNP